MCLQRVLSNYTQVVKEPTHLSGSLLDHVYVKNSILQEYCVSTSMINLYFSDHDAVQLTISNRNIDFNVHNDVRDL